jgi:hypothetical protein
MVDTMAALLSIGQRHIIMTFITAFHRDLILVLAPMLHVDELNIGNLNVVIAERKLIPKHFCLFKNVVGFGACPELAEGRIWEKSLAEKVLLFCFSSCDFRLRSKCGSSLRMALS